jgi:hypothetical protein
VQPDGIPGKEHGLLPWAYEASANTDIPASATKFMMLFRAMAMSP